MIRKIFVIFVIFAITSCGFQAIYSNSGEKSGSSYEKELAAIKIQKDTGRLSQEIRNSLYDLFNPDSLQVEPKYILVLKISNSTTSTFTTTTGSSGRNRVIIDVSYELIDIKTGKSFAQGSSSVSDNYDVQNNRFGTYTADEYTKLNVTKVAAQNIRNFLVNDIIEYHKNDDERYV